MAKNSNLSVNAPRFNSAFGNFPNDFWQESRIKPKFDDVKILFGKELCEKKIQECLESWKKSGEVKICKVKP